MTDTKFVLVDDARGATCLLEQLLSLRETDALGFDTESHGPRLVGIEMINVHRSTLTGFSVAFRDHTAYYVPVNHRLGNAPPAQAAALLRAVSSTQAVVWMHNAKFDGTVLRRAGYEPPRVVADSMILMWMLGMPGFKGKKPSFGLKHLVKHHYGRERADFVHTTKGRQFCDLDPREALEYAAADAADTLQLGEDFISTACELRLQKAFWEVEMPCVAVVQHMESAGFAIDSEALVTLRAELDTQLSDLRDEWTFVVPGVDIGSPAQVSDHFFRAANTGEGKNLWPTKGTKKGKPRVKKKDGVVIDKLPARVSVNKDAMEQAAKHPQVDLESRAAAVIRLEFQALDKNRSTYTTKLVESAQQHLDGRIHASFHQTGTRTGRFSSSDPNLQNIPVRSELGRRVKSAFVSAPGWSLISADYSQIELRVLAHLCGRGYLFDAYMDGADVHQRTADRLGVSRDVAKTCNFAPIYGSGATKFAKVAGCSLKEAHETLANLKKLMWAEEELKARIVAAAERRGFVRTLGGRLRRIPEFQAHEGKTCQRTPDNWECEWCYEQSKAKRIAFNCFDYDTEVLTPTGWKNGRQVGDEEVLLTKNADTGALEWQTAGFKHFPDYDGPVHRWESRNFSAVTTPTHRWLVDMKSGYRRCVVTQDFRGHGDERIYRVGNYTPPYPNLFTDDEIRLLGWAATDCCHKATSPGRTAFVFNQAKPDTTAELTALLAKFGVTGSKRGDLTTWRLGVDVASSYEPWVRGRLLSWTLLWSLTKHQARVLLQTIQRADGDRICASSKEKAERYQALATIAGYHASITERDARGHTAHSTKVQAGGVTTRELYYTVRVCRRPRVQVTADQMSVELGSGVWCPYVLNTYVVVRRAGNVYVTGQTPIQGSAGDIFKVAMVKMHQYFVDTGCLDAHVKIIGQVHDELTLEVRDDKVEHVLPVVKNMMEGAMQLKVPLLVEPKVGKTWAK